MVTKYKIIALALGISLLTPSVTLAETSATGQRVKEGQARPVATKNFCTELAALTTQTNERINKGQTKLGEHQQKRQENLGDREQKRTDELAKIRSEAETKRAASYNLLIEKAETEAQKAAVTAYRTAIENGVTARKSAVDAAITAYWAAVKDALSQRQAAVTTAEQNFTTAVKQALDTATAECSGSTAPATARQNYQTSLKTARTKFASDRKAIDKIGEQIRALAQTRNIAVQKAVEDFKKIAADAKTTLRAAFKNIE